MGMDGWAEACVVSRGVRQRRKILVEGQGGTAHAAGSAVIVQGCRADEHRLKAAGITE